MESTVHLHINLLAIVSGAQEALSFPFFAKHVKLVDCAYVPRHHALGVTQFFSSVLAGEHRVMLVLCATRGVRTFADLLQYDSEASDLVRSTFVIAAVWTYVRHFHRFEQYPWKLAPIGSSVVPEAHQVQIAMEFSRACPHCLDIGYGRRLREMTTIDPLFFRSHGILSPFWMHGSNKARTHPLNKWGLFAARSVNAFVRSTMPPPRPKDPVVELRGCPQPKCVYIHSWQCDSKMIWVKGDPTKQIVSV
jgi:hypothetical protein